MNTESFPKKYLVFGSFLTPSLARLNLAEQKPIPPPWPNWKRFAVKQQGN